MDKQRTLAIIKPDAVVAGHMGDILNIIEKKPDLDIIAIRMFKMTTEQAAVFYTVHQDRPFYSSLCHFMSSGDVLAMVLEGPNAIRTWRKMMGDTDSAEAPSDTIRGMFGTDIERNAVHGSDAPETSATEIPFFFPGYDLAR